jgi:glycosyltransferase involved in cell wall biosynthesis
MSCSVVDVSVVIPCRNGELTLGEQLEALVRQETSAVFEIIVADNGSTDGTAALVHEYAQRDARVRTVDASAAPGVNVARNAGARSAQGGLILLCDADDVVHPGWIDAHWRAYMNGAQCVGGGVDRVLDDGQRIARERQLYRIGARDVPYCNGANCGFTAEAFRRVGGFDESFAGGADEIDFFWRLGDAGFSPELVPEAVINKRMRTELTDTFRQHYGFGRGEGRLIRKFGCGPSTIRVAVAIVHTFVWIVLTGTSRRRSDWHRHCLKSLAWHFGFLDESFRSLVSRDEISGQSDSPSGSEEPRSHRSVSG